MGLLLLDYLKEHIVMELAKIRWGKKAILLSFKYTNWEKCNCINVIAFIKTMNHFYSVEHSVESYCAKLRTNLHFRLNLDLYINLYQAVFFIGESLDLMLILD